MQLAGFFHLTTIYIVKTQTRYKKQGAILNIQIGLHKTTQLGFYERNAWRFDLNK